MSYQTNANALFNLQQNSQQYAAQKDTTWLKLPQGSHRLRICPAWNEEGTPVRMIVNHQKFKSKDGYDRNPLCYQYAFDNQNIAQALFNKNVLKKEDLEFYQKYGCPYCLVSNLVIQMNGKKNNKFYPKPTFLWNVVYRADSKIYKFSTSKKIFDNVAMFASAYPSMFNVDNGMDIAILATGDGMQRRYNSNLIPDPVPLGVDLTTNKLHDLDIAMADGYRNLNETMELLLNTVPNLLPILGINPSQFVTSAPI